MKLTENFTLAELTKSETAEKNNIDNTPDAEQIECLKQLCENILQPLRDDFQKPLVISSGFRSKKLALLVGSKTTSQHCKGQAADFTIPGIDNKKVFKHIIENLPMDQVILEYYKEDDTKEYSNEGWIHCSYIPNGRGQALTKDDTGYKLWQ
jgi:zinc D-Ala-D-Ala carboxypeptidase